MRRWALGVFFSAFSGVSAAGADVAPVRFIVVAPDLADAEPACIHLASSADGWSEQGRPLERLAPGIYAATLEFERGARLEYKFMRERSWATVEKAAGGAELPNRVLRIDGETGERVVVQVVARWADRPAGRHVELNVPGEAARAALERAASLTGDIRRHDAFRSPHAASVPLSDAEIATRQHELDALGRRTLGWRALQYLLHSWACQTFWAAVLIYAVTAGVTAPRAWLFSAAAYSGASVLVAAMHAWSPPVRVIDSSGSRPGCKTCGK